MEIRQAKNGNHLRLVESIYDPFRAETVVLVEVQETQRYRLLTVRQWDASKIREAARRIPFVRQACGAH